MAQRFACTVIRFKLEPRGHFAELERGLAPPSLLVIGTVVRLLTAQG